MPSYRRKAVEIEAVTDDIESQTPESLSELLRAVRKIADIAVEGYTTVTVTVKGRPEELKDLANELQTWTPGPGWSPEALRLFKALRGEE